MRTLAFTTYRAPLGVTLLLALAGCSNVPARVDTLPENAQAAKAPRTDIAQQLESHLHLKRDPELQVFLRRLAQDLAAYAPTLKNATIGVLVFEDSARSFRDFSLPGNRIYLSDLLLKSLEFENELAAVLALELGHLEGGQVGRKIEEKRLAAKANEFSGMTLMAGIEGLLPAPPGSPPPASDFFGPAGIFAASDQEQSDAIVTAVHMLYSKGFDPRGLIRIWSLLAEKAQQDHLPFSADSLAKYEELTRKEISAYPPLRNPVVQSDVFTEVRKRIHAL